MNDVPSPPWFVLVLFVVVVLPVGIVATLFPKRVQQWWLERYERDPSLSAVNPFLALQKSDFYLVLIRIWGVGGIVMALIAIWVMIDALLRPS